MSLVLSASGGGPRNVAVPWKEAAKMAKGFLAELHDAATRDASAASVAATEKDNESSGNDNDTTLLTLDLSGRAWELKSLQQLDPVFAAVFARVTTLKLNDILAAPPLDNNNTQDGLQSLQHLADFFATAPRLHTVHLDDNAMLGTRGMAVLRPLLGNENLRRLSMEQCGLTSVDGATLYEILGGSSHGTGQLRSLALGRNPLLSTGPPTRAVCWRSCCSWRNFPTRRKPPPHVRCCRSIIRWWDHHGRWRRDWPTVIRRVCVSWIWPDATLAVVDKEKKHTTPSGRSASACAGRRLAAWST